MPFSAFNNSPSDQLRQAPPTGYVSDPLDGFPAVVVSGTPPAANTPNTYPLADADELELEVDSAPELIVFSTLDFVDIASATPLEVADAITAAGVGVTAVPEGNFVRVTTMSSGASAALQILGGSANDALVFSPGEVRGTQGTATLVLGHALPGRIVRMMPGDFVRVEQSLTFDESRFQLLGAARLPELPSGISWRLSLTVGGVSLTSRTYASAGTFSINDLALPVTQSAGAAVLGIELRPLGLAVGGQDLELPAVFVDLVEPITTTDVQLINRNPYPDQVEVDADPLDLVFDLASAVVGVNVDTTETRVFVDGFEIFDGAVFSGGWSGLVTNSGTDRLFTLSHAGPFDSEQLITIRVTSEHVGGAGAIDELWSITTLDTLDLRVLEAQARDKLLVRVQFDDDVNPVLAVDPANYIFETLTIPAVTVIAQSIELVGTNAVNVTVDFEWSQGADYRLTVLNVTDTTGNPLDSEADQVDFAGFLPLVPAGRDFQLLDFFSADNKRRDETGDLRKFVLCLQDVTDLLLCLVDRWTEIIDIDRAPERFVDAILLDLGNPFAFIELSLVDKRRLAGILLDIYKRKGTEEGLVDTVRFLTGVSVTLDIINDRDDFWLLGFSKLGLDTVLAPPVGSPLWYSFWIDSPVELTDELRDQIVKIAVYMKAAHEHILGLREPQDVPPALPTFWKLEIPTLSELGKTTILGD